MARKGLFIIFGLIISLLIVGSIRVISELSQHIYPLISTMFGIIITLSGIFCVILIFFPDTYYNLINRKHAEHANEITDKENFGFEDMLSTQIHWSEIVSNPDYDIIVEKILDGEIIDRTPKHHFHQMYEAIRNDPFINEILITEIALMIGENYFYLKKSFNMKTELSGKISKVMSVLLSLRYGSEYIQFFN